MIGYKEDVGLKAFQDSLQQINEQGDTLNEAATRLRIINTILFDVLDWTKLEVDVEKHNRAGYADYVMLCAGKPVLVLEAKKKGIPFAIEGVIFEPRPYTFDFVAKESRAAAAALEQAMGYAVNLGSRYVAITNGFQWLLALTFVEDQPLSDRLVYVFESYSAIENRFRCFAECFSKEALSSNVILPRLTDSLQQPPPAKLSASMPGYPMAGTRNAYQNELSYVLDYVWNLMSKEEASCEFVKNCYVSPTAHSETIALVREILSRRKTEDEMIAENPIENITGLSGKLPSLPSEKPFVILGEIGRGKTSFLKHLRYVAAHDILNNYIQIDINFLDRPDNAAEVPAFVYSEIEKQLLEIYDINVGANSFVRGVLNRELKALRDTPQGAAYDEESPEYKEFELNYISEFMKDKHSYLKMAFQHLKKGRNQSLAIFFDNLDRRPINIQEEAFLKSSAIARDWACLVFVCLRPVTFHKSQESGVLDTIAPRTFTVSHPNLSLVLKKRFAYAKSIAEGKRLPAQISAGSGDKHIAFKLPHVALILDSCEFSARKRHGIIPMLESVSNGNIRKMLSLTKEILCSGHLDTLKIVNRIEEDGSYTIPDFEGIKALMYGEYMHYDSEKSPFINLFDVLNSDLNQHFIRLSMLSYLSSVPSDGADAGFVDRSKLNVFLNASGYSLQSIESAVSLLGRKELVKFPVVDPAETGASQRIKITSLGRFHIFNLVMTFQYLDAVLVDTPIMNDEVRSAIRDVFSIRDRLDRTQAFLSYLDDAGKCIEEGSVQKIWKNISETARDELADIERRIK